MCANSGQGPNVTDCSKILNRLANNNLISISGHWDFSGNLEASLTGERFTTAIPAMGITPSAEKVRDLN